MNEERFLAKDLEEKHRKIRFTCQICGGQLIPKMGKIRVKHFAHKSGVKHNSEPESEEHSGMKYYFLEEFEKQGLSSDIEVGVRHGDKLHEADVVVYKISNHMPLVKGIIVECQCSSIGVDELEERTRHYLGNGFIPIWVLGKFFIDRLQKKGGLLAIESKLMECYGVLFVFNDGVVFLHKNGGQKRISSEMLVKAVFREINSEEWMPLNQQINCNLSFSNGMGFHQFIGKSFVSLEEVKSFTEKMLENYPIEQVTKLMEINKPMNGDDLYLVLKDLSERYVSKVYRFNTECWKCHRGIDVYWEAIWKGPQYIDSGPPSLSPDYPNLKRVYSKTMGEYVTGNTCPYCKSYQGNFFIRNNFLGIVYEGNKYLVDFRLDDEFKLLMEDIEFV